MVEIIKNLQNIQENLVGIILPVAITAVVSIVTILINAYIQIKLQYCKYNSEQYKLMQTFYPKLKNYLLELKLSMKNIESSQLYSDFGQALNKYISFKNNETKYRRHNQNEVQSIDDFAKEMEKYCEKTLDIYNYLYTCILPGVPIGHPIVKKKISKMITVLQYYSLLVNKYNKKAIHNDFFNTEIKKLEKKWKIKFESLLIEKYIFLLDKWLMKY